MKVTIQYDGKYPNLCSGTLIVTIGSMTYDGVCLRAARTWKFPPHCLSSGGCVSFDEDWNEEIEEGPWTISEWPKRFPEKYKKMVEEAVNSQIEYGCCGGCV